ncbi:hypothetical protein ACTWQK_45100 [Streptomyces sp. 6N106]
MGVDHEETAVCRQVPQRGLHSPAGGEAFDIALEVCQQVALESVTGDSPAELVDERRE